MAAKTKKVAKKTVKAPLKKAVKTVAKAKTKTAAKVVKSKPVAKKPVLKAKPQAKKPAVKAKVAVRATSKATVVQKAPAKKPEAKVVAKTVAVTPAARPVATTAHIMPRPVASRPGMSPLHRPVNVNPHRPVVAARPANDTPIDFNAGDYVVYPAHGVGTIEGIETQTIAGMTVTLFAITFEKDRMRLKIPVAKAQSSGLRKLSSGDRLKDALKTLQGKARIKRTMWSRRAQEYEAKINSGDPVQIAEVLRDLRRPKDDTEQSYSERQIYQSALERLAREVAAVQKIAEGKAVEQLETVLAQAA